MLETGNSLLFEVAGGDNNFVRACVKRALPRSAALLLTPTLFPHFFFFTHAHVLWLQSQFPSTNPYAGGAGGGYAGGAGGGYAGGPAAYSQHVYYEQQQRPGGNRQQSWQQPQQQGGGWGQQQGGGNWQQQQQYGGDYSY